MICFKRDFPSALYSAVRIGRERERAGNLSPGDDMTVPP
jgi:hypothetical protein